MFELPDDLAGELAGMLAETAWSMTPEVVLAEFVGPYRVDVVECVMPEWDGPPTRGHLWHAVTGEYEMRPAAIEFERRIPGIPVGGRLLSTSRVSAEAAMRNARAVLARGRRGSEYAEAVPRG